MFGYTVGRIATIQIAYSQSQIKFVPDVRPSIPIVNIEGVVNGQLEGRISSGARLFLGGEYILPNSSGSFSVPAGPFLVNNVTITIPKGMYFVASKRGKKYYSVTSGAAQNLSPANRVYFQTGKEAEQAGYLR